MNKKTKIALGIGIPVAMVVIFLLPLVVGEMNSSRVETKSGYNFYVCSGLNSRHEQRSAEYYQKVTEYDQKLVHYLDIIVSRTLHLVIRFTYNKCIKNYNKCIRN